ncbi:hypothetical protein [uncultured Nostoc sp.]|nr:hypothetical protein [uncultured Nostoc sp.]
MSRYIVCEIAIAGEGAGLGLEEGEREGLVGVGVVEIAIAGEGV